MPSALDEIIASLDALAPGVRDALLKDCVAQSAHMPWVPNPGPQSMAYLSQADELFFGGSAGGGKTDLEIGLAITQHKRSLILRRINLDAISIAERALEIIKIRDGFNATKQTLHYQGRMIEFHGIPNFEDRQRFKGDPKDFIGWDEIGDFLEGQYTFVNGWNRSTDPNQRSRVVATGNPPTTPEGMWVIKRWAAWLDPAHPKFGIVKDGDLLWYTTIGGEDTEVDGPGPHMIDGEKIIAKSRTFIRGKLSDNPDLHRTNYDAVLAGLPPELREAYRDGKFDAGLKDRPFQLIPTAWARAAQERWTDRPPVGVPMCAIGIDCTGGGLDPMVIAPRHDGWYALPVSIPGKDIPAGMAGRAAAGYVVAERRDNAIMIVDMGGGYGGPLYEHLHTNFDNAEREPIVLGFKGSEASVRRSQDGHLGFGNRRTEALWRFREALDPGQAGGSPIFLPPGGRVLGDLTAVTYEVRRGMIHAEPKEHVVKRLGRSTNDGDAIVMAWTAGPIASTDGAAWDSMRNEMSRSMRLGGRRPVVVVGRQNSGRR